MRPVGPGKIGALGKNGEQTRLARSTRHDSNNSACFRVDDRPCKGLNARTAIDIRQRSLAAILEWLTSLGVRRDCCPGLEPMLEDRDPSDPLIGTWPQIIVCREPSARRNLRGEAKA